MKRNRNGISLFLKRKIAFFETENHWPYKGALPWVEGVHPNFQGAIAKVEEINRFEGDQ